jgi:hypothetical protein
MPATAAALPVRFALRYSPATLACEYKGADGRLSTLKLEFENVTPTTDAQAMLDLATRELAEVVALKDVDPSQLQALVVKLIAGNGGGGGGGGGTRGSGAPSSRRKDPEPEVDMDDLPDDLKAAMAMDDDDDDAPAPAPAPLKATYSGLKLPGGPSSAPAPAPAPAPVVAKKKAPDAEDCDDLLDDLLGDDIDAPPEKSSLSSSSSSARRPAATSPAPAPAKAKESEEEEEEDLNKVSEFRLKMVKKQMDEQFEKNLIRPGMPGYQFDKAVDFGEGEEELSWDNESDDNDEE